MSQHSDSFVGVWKLRPEKSAFDANHRPSEATMVFELESESHYVMRAGGVNGAGKIVTEQPQHFIVGRALSATTSGVDAQLRTFTQRTVWERLGR